MFMQPQKELLLRKPLFYHFLIILYHVNKDQDGNPKGSCIYKSPGLVPLSQPALGCSSPSFSISPLPSLSLWSGLVFELD